VVIVAPDGDSRIQLVIEAVEFWNGILKDLGISFELGAVTRGQGLVSAAQLSDISSRVISRAGPIELPENIANISGDMIVVLSDGEFLSFAARWPTRKKALVAIRSDRVPPLTLKNVGRNVIAHELGHAIGLGHNDNPKMLMCGRPAPCRPNAFVSTVEGYFPLAQGDKESLLKMYSAHWTADTK
jgi:hypothetical protein